MKYNFDQVIDRRHTDSFKWAFNAKLFGSPDVLSMWVADMDFQSPAPVVQALVQRAQHGIFGYAAHSDAYYDAIVEWMRKRHGWEIKREWIAHAPGVVNALDLAVHAFTRPGDKIIIQPPIYPPFFNIVRNNGRQLIANPLKLENGRYRMDLPDLERQIDHRTKLLILCSPHNPVGRVWTREELTELAALCLRQNILILSDEIHSDLVLRGHTHTPLATLSEELAQNTLTFIAPSKTFNVPGLAASAIIIPNAGRLTTFKATVEDFGLEFGNIFGITALQAAYRYGEEWLEQLLDYIQGNVDFALDFFATRVPKMQVIRPEATYLLWLDCRELGLDNAALKDLMLRQARVALNDGPTFGPGGEGFQRMNLGCPRATLEEGLRRIERAVNGL
jgi:cystathionine beta-lyase